MRQGKEEEGEKEERKLGLKEMNECLQRQRKEKQRRKNPRNMEVWG